MISGAARLMSGVFCLSLSINRYCNLPLLSIHSLYDPRNVVLLGAYEELNLFWEYVLPYWAEKFGSLPESVGDFSAGAHFMFQIKKATYPQCQQD